MLILWLEWIFLCLPLVKFDTADRAATIAKFKTIVLLTVIYLTMVFVFDTPEWIIQGILAVWAFFVKMHTFRLYIASFRHAPSDDDEEADGTVVVASKWKTFKRLVTTGLLKLYMIDPLEDLHNTDDDDDIHEKID
jgi:hypothetical protein